jgi:2-oxoglutarate dehydrogenase E2 component (dihydrolipoamide succinyltransferase)
MMNDAISVLVPQENVNDEAITIVSWRVANGTHVEAGQALAEVEGSKTVFEIYAPVSGLVQYHIAAGQDVKVGTVLCKISNQLNVHGAGNGNRSPLLDNTSPPATGLASSQISAKLTDAMTSGARAVTPQGEKVEIAPTNPLSDTYRTTSEPRFSEMALALIDQHNVDRNLFMGQGLVRARDVLATLEPGHPPNPSMRRKSGDQPQRAFSAPAPVPAVGVPVRSEKLSRSKQTEIRYLASSYYNSLSSVVTVAVPTKGLKAAVAAYAFDVTPLAIVAFESSRLLLSHPGFNAYYASGAIHFYEEINIGVAIDGDQGLKVPVLRNADVKSLKDVSAELQTLLLRYVEDKLPPECLAGGTFTITDLSGEGVFTFYPLINQGQGAILGIGSEFFAPGGGDGMFNLILAFDHQLTEGRRAAKFLRELAQRLQAYEGALGGQIDNQVANRELQCARCFTPLRRLRQLDSALRGDQFLIEVLRPDGKKEYRCSHCVQGW